MAIEGVRDRVGSLGSTRIRLAQTGRPYKHFYVNSVRERQDQAGTDVRSEVQRVDVREWKLDDWTGGFGNPVWRSDQASRYNIGRSVCPEYRTTSYGGLVLGPSVSTAGDDTPAADFTPANGRLFRGSNPANTALTMYATKTRAIHPWLFSSDSFDATAITVGAVGADIIAMADPGDGYLYCMEDTTYDIYQVDADAPANVLHFDWSAATVRWGAIATMTQYRGEVYVLGRGGDLYLLDRGSTNTATKVVDAFYSIGSTAIVDAPYRLSSSDVGPVWFHATRTGVDIWEYNVAEDSSSIVATIDAPASPWSIFHTGGFTFVAYTASYNTAVAPNVYVYYFREGVEGTLGPFATVADAYNVNLPGLVNSRFVTVVAGEYLTTSNPWDLFVYDLAGSALHHWASGVEPGGTGSVATSAQIVGRDMLVATLDESDNRRVEHVDMEQYSTVTAGEAYLDTGRYDFDLPGTEKALVDITVITDPLPANTSVQLQYSLDGATFAGSGLDITTDGETSTTFSFAASNLRFYELELRILLNSTSTSATPTVRSVTARALPTSVQEYWDIDVDLNPQRYEFSSGGDQVTPQSIVAALETLKTNQQAVTFTNPWEVDVLKGESVQTDTVWVVSVEFPDIGANEQNGYARLRLMRAALS